MRPSTPARLATVAVLLLFVAACAAAPPAFDAAKESSALMRRDAEWAALASAGKQVDSIVSYWSDDAVIMEPGQPAVVGKQAIRTYVASSLSAPGFSIHWVSEPPVFSPDGQMAYMRGTDEMTVPGPKGEPIALHLQGYSIWRKGADGVWRCTVDVANEKPAAGPT